MSRQHHTKNKGDIGCLKVQVKMAELGFTILIPLSEHEVFDFVAYKDGDFKKVQAKYRSIENGSLTVPFKTAWADKNGSHINYIDKTEIDIIAVYCPETDKVYFVNPTDYENSTSLNLRVEQTKNNQRKGILFAENFLSVP